MLQRLRFLRVLFVVACVLSGLGVGLTLGFYLQKREIAHARAQWGYSADLNWPNEPYYLAAVGALLGGCIGFLVQRR